MPQHCRLLNLMQLVLELVVTCTLGRQEEVHHRAQEGGEGSGQTAGHHHKHMLDSPAVDRGPVVLRRCADMQAGLLLQLGCTCHLTVMV